MSLSALVSDVADYMQPQFEAHGQTLSVDVSQPVPSVQGDESRLRQVLINLLNNACKFTSQGGYTRVRVFCEGDYIVVEIEDNGIGIEDSEKERLFQPYNRIENSGHYFAGLGLGLALSKQIIDLHQGQIWVASRKGQGSTFYFKLPVNLQESAIEEKSSEQIRRILKGPPA
jgi:signal transduction histidine kinase